LTIDRQTRELHEPGARTKAFAMKRSLFLASIVISASASSYADEPDAVQVLPCRPTIACTAEIVPAGTVEVETGYAQRRASGAGAQSWQVLFKYSVSDRVQLQVGSNSLALADGVYAGGKVVVVEQSAHVPAIAVSALFMTPTRGDAMAIQQTTDGYFWAYASKDLPFGGIHADYNLGVNVLSIGDHPATQILNALSLSRDLGRGVGAMLEGYAFEGGAPYATHDAGVLTGLTYSIAPQVMFDAGVDVALYRDARDLTLFGGVTFAPYAR
jgi:hypothetical protein